ncbi:hypothetical protein BD309DRAFT_872520 [Dichomitus squalens]|uniref:Uncharacterized protein n=1 Tax=Dichomitus squalens TaxID=114155 RepID=A0A4Q9PEV6_9APHY|nr:hypothetical protein BD309DRAFT_872520 [Dichomitus squalens]TBU51612.1 hypothetical protein BD310DRAFT_833953 [Dichomitus squalens]
MGTPFGPDVQQIHSKHGGKPGPMGATPLPPDLPPQYQHEREREFRFIPPKGGPGQIHMGIPPRSQQMLPHPQAQHPMGTPHLRQHHLQDMYGPGPMGMQSRRPSPPLMHSHSAPPAFMLPRSGSPPTTLVLPIKNLGTFVYPRTPFPFLDFPPPYTASGAPSDPLDVRATVFLPARFIPLTRPARPRIWGGALIPAVPPLSGAQRQLCAQFSGTHAQYGRPWPDEVREGRRVYTDDSDLFLCALHAGWVSWSQARKARREGNDLRIEVRLTREARYIGGFGNALHARERGEVVEDLGAEDDGRELLSSGWGNGHDGAGMEILNAEFVLPGTAHSFGLRNRSQRMLEYAERRSALGCAPRSSRKRRRLLNGTFAGDESAMQTRLNEDDEELSATRVMVFGTDSSWPEIGYVDLDSVMLFFERTLNNLVLS